MSLSEALEESKFSTSWKLFDTSDCKVLVTLLQNKSEEVGYTLNEDKTAIIDFIPNDLVDQTVIDDMAKKLDSISFDIYVRIFRDLSKYSCTNLCI